MGADAKVYFARLNKKGELEETGSLDDIDRNYALFGWFADVRNYSGLTPISELGTLKSFKLTSYLKEELEDWYCAIAPVKTILETDYDAPIENRRVTIRTGNIINGGGTCEPGHGEITTLRNLFGNQWFEILESIDEADEYIIFAFDQT